MNTSSEHIEKPLLRDDFNHTVPPYPIEPPSIISGSTYYFESESGLRYEVLFAKKKENYLENIINFSVISDEFEDEYSETNRGEVYRVIATVTEIIRVYHENHKYSISYEFSGEFKKGKRNRETSVRTLLYYRHAERLLHPSWNLELIGNKVIVYRKKYGNG